MSDEPKFVFVQSARIGEWAVMNYTSLSSESIYFYSQVPVTREHANLINQAVEDLTGVEIPTILEP